MKGLLTTTVGSFPKPEYIKRARADFSMKKLSLQGLNELEKKAIKEVIKIQEKLGLDILVDGEMYRGDMATFFAEKLEGFKISGLVRSYGNRYYKKPIAIGKIRRVEPVTIDMFKFTQGLTSKPVKGIVTGPYTMTDWSFNEYYSSRKDMITDLAYAVHDEAADLESAGAKYIQIDEPAISTRPEELDLAIKAMKIVTDGINAKTIMHICYGDFEKIYPKMLELPVDQIDLEMANSGFDLLNLFKKYRFTKEIGFGVIDVHTHKIETKEYVKNGIRKALEVFSPDKVFVDPDCGLKTRTEKEAHQKLKVMIKATMDVKRELNIE